MTKDQKFYRPERPAMDNTTDSRRILRAFLVALVLTFILLIVLAVSGRASTTESVIKIQRLSSTQAAISCKNGADPTGRKEGDIVIISCGR